jgi:hypothetical protein
MVMTVVLAVVLVDGIFALRRREYMGRARRYQQLSVAAATLEQTQLKSLKLVEGGSAGFERAIAEAEQRRDAATDGPERHAWEERVKERRSLLAYHRDEVVRGQRKSAALATAQRKYLQGLTNKYIDAANHPWRSVPPDPTPPGRLP